MLLLLPCAGDGLSRIGLGKLCVGTRLRVTVLHVIVMLIALAWFPTFVREYRGEFAYGDERVPARTDRGLTWTGPPRWVLDNNLSRLLDWVNAQTERYDALAHGQPWPFTFFTQRPATLLPIRLSPEALRGFLVDYKVAYVLLDTRDRDRRDYQIDLDALEGVRSTPVGAYRVYDTRSLWR